ncbi:MAG: porin [Saprospiraceae bacterium]|nr:porin [Saprospiraceae bacterium]
MRFLFCLSLTLSFVHFGSAQSANDSISKEVKPTPAPKWYESVSIRGYTQIRYNRFLETNPSLNCEQCDRSWGNNGGVFIRRLRMIIYGQIGKRVYYYFQPDFASSASSTGLHFGQVRDMYFDVGIDPNNEFRFRIGQSKVPFGFENLQSSQNRLPLDRADATNSAVANERDHGVFFYWAPKKYRKLFSSLVSEGLKGSGDYGIFAFGAYNGQTANKPELNNKKHFVTRLSLPIKIGNQLIEPGIQAHTGHFTIASDQLSSGVKSVVNKTYSDRRVAASFVLYSKPIGILAEYNFGEGPRFNKETDSIELSRLHGGFITVNYMMHHKGQTIVPFVRAQYYDGGKKHERDARAYLVKELEIGLEWQPFRQFELVAMYTLSSRRFEDFILQDNLQTGRLIRLQAQVNF